MKKQSFTFLSALLLALLTFTSCEKDRATDIVESQATTENSNYYTPNMSDFVSSRSGYWTSIPAGSVDMLQQAIEEADAGGVIYLDAGMHTETNRVTVNKRVAIIGDDGAVLKISSPDSTYEVTPGLHVLNAPGTLIKNVEIEPVESSAWCGIMFEESPQSAVLDCKISTFWFGIAVQYSDRVTIIKNHFVDIPGNGVLVNIGRSAYVADNEFEGIGTGVWLCDEWGTLERNNFHDNGTGVLLCNYPEEFGYLTPDGQPFGAERTATGWKLRNNEFTNNSNAGIAVRDGANLNLIEVNNQYSGNGNYDIIVPPDAFILGGALFVPTAHDNFIYAMPDVIIKDCGEHNIINGGTLVDPAIDPC